MKGVVFKSTGSWYKVKADDGRQYMCRTRGKLKLKGAKTTNPVAVGDHVHFVHDEKGEADQGIITSIGERKNYIIRKSVHKTAHGHILASNIDQLIVMVTLSRPATSLGFIDRLLVNSESFRIPALLLFNKIDLLDEQEAESLKILSKMYNNLGYKGMFISALTGRGVEKFHRQLVGKVSMIAGHSGVGKSTLVNKLSPEISQQVEEISDFTLKGKHTTTFAEMFELEPDTYLISTARIKELGIIDMEDWEISHYFPEMRKYLGSCKFNNCLHVHEPGCVVFEALERGEIAESRYLSYLSMLEGEDNRR